MIPRGNTAMGKFATIDEYIAALADPLREVSEKMRPIIDGALPKSAVSSVFHAAPTWSVGPERGTGLVCYLKAYTKYVTFGFWHGQEIDDKSGRMQPGAREMGQVKLSSVDEIDAKLFKSWLRQAWDIEVAYLKG
jgi:hypothetical protein